MLSEHSEEVEKRDSARSEKVRGARQCKGQEIATRVAARAGRGQGRHIEHRGSIAVADVWSGGRVKYTQ